MELPSVTLILDELDKNLIEQVTFPAYSFKEEDQLNPDNKDYVTFHKETNGTPWFCIMIYACEDHQTTSEPIYKDWYMTINYHS